MSINTTFYVKVSNLVDEDELHVTYVGEKRQCEYVKNENVKELNPDEPNTMGCAYQSLYALKAGYNRSTRIHDVLAGSNVITLTTAKAAQIIFNNFESRMSFFGRLIDNIKQKVFKIKTERYYVTKIFNEIIDKGVDLSLERKEGEPKKRK